MENDIQDPSNLTLDGPSPFEPGPLKSVSKQIRQLRDLKSSIYSDYPPESFDTQVEKWVNDLKGNFLAQECLRAAAKNAREVFNDPEDLGSIHRSALFFLELARADAYAIVFESLYWR